ncbi:MAG: hypothetical protein ACRDZ9_07130, partial [Acidimicrobiales bacterium]
MFRRVFWLSVGAGLGLGASSWLAWRLRERARRYRPQRVGAELAGGVRQVVKELRAALEEGRGAMREREEELRAAVSPAGGRD